MGEIKGEISSDDEFWKIMGGSVAKKVPKSKDDEPILPTNVVIMNIEKDRDKRKIVKVKKEKKQINKLKQKPS